MTRDLPTSPHSDLWQSLHALGAQDIDCQQPVLFRRGDPCRGLYMVEEGRVKLLLAPDSPEGQTFEIVSAGAVLGLAETMNGGPHKLTAELIDGARVTYIDRELFITKLHQQQQLCLQIVHMLSEDLHRLYHRFRRIAPSVKRSHKPGSATVH